MIKPEIQTERLVLTPLVFADSQAMFEYRSVPAVCRYQSFEPCSLKDVEKFIDDLQGNVFDTAGTWYQFGMRLKSSGQLIGDFGTHFDGDDPRQVEIGFTLAPNFQGQGLASEAVSGVMDYLFGSLQKHRVYASVDPRNKPSVALLNRVGMRQEAHFRKSYWFKGDWADDLVFGILNSEWTERRKDQND